MACIEELLRLVDSLVWEGILFWLLVSSLRVMTYGGNMRTIGAVCQDLPLSKSRGQHGAFREHPGLHQPGCARPKTLSNDHPSLFTPTLNGLLE